MQSRLQMACELEFCISMLKARTLVPVDAQPLQLLHEVRLRLLRRPRQVRVLNPAETGHTLL